MKKIIIILALICLPLLASAKININTAGSGELEEITGVGPAIAGKIIDYRSTNGLFKTIEEIKNVSGIGDVTFLKMKDEITVGSDSSSASDSSSSDDFSQEVASDDDSSDSTNDSSHTSEVSLSSYQAETFKIGAGRERLATVRTPILFSASQNKMSKEKNSFTWSFGDGTSARGSKVYHSYQFPGRYNVVLNGSIDDEEEAVARTTVLVSEPKVRVSSLDLALGYVEITNDSDKEQNLSGWRLQAGQKIYVFLVDTIISPKTSIKIPLQVIKLNNPDLQEITLAYPDGGVVSGASLASGVDPQRVAELRRELAKVRQQIALLSSGQVTEDVKPSLGESPAKVFSAQEAEDVIALEKKVGWLGRIKNAIFK